MRALARHGGPCKRGALRKTQHKTNRAPLLSDTLSPEFWSFVHTPLARRSPWRTASGTGTRRTASGPTWVPASAGAPWLEPTPEAIRQAVLPTQLPGSPQLQSRSVPPSAWLGGTPLGLWPDPAPSLLVSRIPFGGLLAVCARSAAGRLRVGTRRYRRGAGEHRYRRDPPG
jgi:hypothetical protein